ncbi:MAG: putative Diguanylate cyclase/phosphodiesterase [Frankiales bacterium]|nr:putative Diguanylate cyclase/phosphodiesterase [Frankiales bacterium]
MSGRPGGGARGQGAALAFSLGLGLVTFVILLLLPSTSLADRFAPSWWLFVPAYLLAQHLSVDFEFRKEAHSFHLTQLPATFGILFLAPFAHVAARLLGTAIDSLALRRESPVKAAFNLALGAAEVAVATTVVHALAGSADSGARLWLALLVGLLAAETVGAVSVPAVMRLVGARVSLRQVIEPLTFSAASTVLVAGLAVVALSSVLGDPSSLPVIALLAAGLTVAYRGYRRVAASQQSTEALYAFVKDLGPLDVRHEQTRQALEHVRLLLHARHLDLAVLDGPGEQWRHIVVQEHDAGEAVAPPSPLLQEVARTGAPALRAGRGGGDADRMATPLVGSGGMLGILTVTERLGDTRTFDMRDLRLLETVATELATALERGRLLADLETAATTDSLTGLPNLTETTRLLDLALARGEVLVAAVAVESFREVNDTLGHEVGDNLLLEVTGRLRRACPDAVVGRIGGGRFAVAVPAGIAGNDPEMFGLGVRAQVEGATTLGGVGTHVRLAVGVVRGPEHGTEAATLLRRAETAMHSARDAHGGPVVWEPAYEVKGQRRLAVVSALREALSTGAIGVAFQPKVDTRSGAPTGVEALARWTHPALGAIGPDEFVPLAEASGLMGLLTSSILRQSLTACRGWQRRAANVGVSVNVSADTLLDAAFVTEVAAILTAVGVEPSLLTLELTEGVVMADPALATERMGELRAIGVKISVDDFGTGYSSLTYLKGLPVDEVKIDRGFVNGLVLDPADRAVVRAVVDIAHTLGIRVVAEGVENTQQREVLQDLGVDELQGFLHARPMPAMEMSSWLRQGERAFQA